MFPESVRHRGLKPVRIIAANVRRGRAQIARIREGITLPRRQRLRRVSLPVAHRGDGLGGLAPFVANRAEHERARLVRSHAPREGLLPAQRIINEVADGRAVTGARETVRPAPVVQRERCRPPPLHHFAQNIHRRLKPRTGPHQRTRTWRASEIHIATRIKKLTAKGRKRLRVSAPPTCRTAWSARKTT